MLNRDAIKGASIELSVCAVELWVSLRGGVGAPEVRLFRAEVSPESIVDLESLRTALAQQDLRVEVREELGAATPLPVCAPAGAEPYRQAWEDFRSRKTRAIACFVGFAVTGLLGAASGPAGIVLVPILVVLWGAVVVTGFQLAFFRCPRCRRLFAGPLGRASILGECVHCGLPHGANGPALR